MDGHEPVEPAEEPPANEHCGQSDDSLVPGDRGGELGLVSDLVHSGVHPEPLQQSLHHVAEAAPAPPHHQHRALHHRPPHRLPAVAPCRRALLAARALGLGLLGPPRPRRQPARAV
ncbi:hypothetical protein D1007_61997 [Hordeum vulgare]|nr:hypothetical protein D1007_61997 [Hordeum vulgare]